MKVRKCGGKKKDYGKMPTPLNDTELRLAS